MPSALVVREEGPVLKRRKLSATKQPEPPRASRIFAPYRVSEKMSTKIGSSYSNTFATVDSRSSIAYRCTIHLYSAGQNHFSDHDFRRPMSTHLRPAQGVAPHVYDKATDARRHHSYICMERSSVCGMGWLLCRGRGWRLGTQTGQADSRT